MRFSNGQILPFFCALSFLLLFPAMHASSEEEATKHTLAISDSIKKIIEERSPLARYQQSQILLSLVEEEGTDNITENDIINLTELMKNPQDSSRYWVAEIFKIIGPRAKSAVPVLKEAFAQESCLMTSKTSASVIGSALIKIGATIPPVRCPVVLNSYAEKISVKLFSKGKNQVFKNVLPNQCIKINPEQFLLTKLTVIPENLPIKTYARKEFDNVIGSAYQTGGMLSVDANGLSYMRTHKCLDSITSEK